MQTQVQPYWEEKQYAYDRLFLDRDVFRKRKFYLGMDKEGYPADGFLEARFKIVGQLPIGYECANHFLTQITQKVVETEFFWRVDWDKSGCIPTQTNEVETIAALFHMTNAIYWCIEMDRKYKNQPRLKQMLALDTPTSWHIGDLSIQIEICKSFKIK
jgi:hypothetical protein